MIDIGRKVPVLEPAEAIDEVLGELGHGRDSSVAVGLARARKISRVPGLPSRCHERPALQARNSYGSARS